MNVQGVKFKQFREHWVLQLQKEQLVQVSEVLLHVETNLKGWLLQNIPKLIDVEIRLQALKLRSHSFKNKIG